MTEFINKQEAIGRLNELIHEISEDGSPCYLTENGQTTAVLLDVNRYHALMDAVECMGALSDRPTDTELVERLIASESRKRKKSIRYFGFKGRELD